jgi:hypothetical protein
MSRGLGFVSCTRKLNRKEHTTARAERKESKNKKANRKQKTKRDACAVSCSSSAYLNRKEHTTARAERMTSCSVQSSAEQSRAEQSRAEQMWRERCLRSGEKKTKQQNYESSKMQVKSGATYVGERKKSENRNVLVEKKATPKSEVSKRWRV